ncbi:MAG: lipopolysaccharide biosynthesis protein [Blastocatellia bacterium]
MFARNIKLILGTNSVMLMCGVVTSLLTAWALGPQGRGDLAVIVMWPNVCAMLLECGLPAAHRYWLARKPECLSPMFSNAVIYAGVVGFAGLALAELVVPRLVGERSSEVMFLLRIYLLVIPASLLFDLLRGILEGTRQFAWLGAARLIFFGVQAGGYLILWLFNLLTVRSATYTMIGSHFSAMLLALAAVYRTLHPVWSPGRDEMQTALQYGGREYPGTLTEFTTLRLDQLMLGSLATSTSIGLYFIAVRLAEITAVLASSVADAMTPEVAATAGGGNAIYLLTRSLRQTLYAHLFLLLPLWMSAPLLLRIFFGDGFLEATQALRLLMLASIIWSVSAIAISGLNGFGHPGLSTTARLTAAIVTTFLLLRWLPDYGINGAAMASLAGYTAMLAIALFWLSRTSQINLLDCFRPRLDDLPLAWLKSVFQQAAPQTREK